MKKDLALLGMPDIKLQNILRITCEVISMSYENRKFDSQTTEAPNSSSWRTNRTPWMTQTKWI